VALHGPPLGGKVRVSLYIVTIEIAFGEAKQTAPPLLWDNPAAEKSFVKSFLPNPPEKASNKEPLPNPQVMTISIVDGLLKESKDGKNTVLIVSPQKLVLSARTLLPVTAALFNDNELGDIPQPTIGGKTPIISPQKLVLKKDEKDKKDKLVLVTPQLTKGESTGFGVRPMKKNSLYSLLEVNLETKGNTSPGAKHYLDQYLDISIVTKSIPLALWGNTPLDTRNAPKEQMIDNALVGFEIRTKAGPRPWETPALDLCVLAYDLTTIIFDWTTPNPTQDLSGFGDKTLANTVNADNVKTKRAKILEVLAKDRKIMKPEDIHLEQLPVKAEFIFQDMPAMARVGQYPPRGYLA
jgi:hypothetical protein